MRLVIRFCLAMALLCTVPAYGQRTPVASAGGGHPRILLIYSADRLVPASQQFDEGLRDALGTGLKEDFDLYTEFLGADRFTDEGQEKQMAEHFRSRYATRAPRTIVAVGPEALAFARKYLGDVLPGVPVVFGCVRTGWYVLAPGHTEYGVTMRLALRPMLEAILQLQPGVGQVVVVSGASLADRDLGTIAHAEFEALAGKVRLTYWSGLPMAEMLASARRLSPDAAIFFLSLNEDGRGLSFVPERAVEELAGAAHVPIYGVSSSYFGHGVVGGQTEMFEEQGDAVGRLTAAVLAGHPPSRQGAVEGPKPRFQFDARQLTEWRIERTKLPAGSTILYEEPPPLVSQHVYLVFALITIILLSVLVMILFLNRQRLARAERRLNERLRFEQLTSGISAALINTPPERMDREIERALEEVRTALALDRCLLFDFHAGSRLKVITHRAESPGIPPLDATMAIGELPWFFNQVQQLRVIVLADADRDLPPGADAERTYCASRRIHSVLIMPVRQTGDLVQWVGFFTARREQKWSPELTSRLHVIGESLVSAVAGSHAELALRQSEQMNRDILSSLNEQVALLDRHGTIVIVNQAWHRFPGNNGGPALGSNYLEACRSSAVNGHADGRPLVEGLEGVLNGTLRHFEQVYAREFPGEPQPRWFRMTVAPFNTPGGGAVVMNWDVSERQRMHEALRQSEERYREVVESQTELVCRYRLDSTLTFVNEAYCRFFGRSRESLLNRPFLELIPTSSHPFVRDQITTMYRERQPHTYEHEVTLPDGSTRWQHWTDHPIVNEHGQIEEFQAIGHDITDRKRAEEANRNLTHAARLAVAGELTASIAHEINQPLGAILSNADAAEILIERPNPPLDEIRAILVDIRKDDLRASEVIRHLRSLLRKREMELHPLDINDVIGEVIRLAAADAMRRRMQFVRDFAVLLPVVNGDRVHLQQVLLNLLLNAMDSMDDVPLGHRQLTLRTQRMPEGGVEVFVSDTGHGIPPARLAHIFDSFFTTKKEGMGLGLSIARSIIEAHRGTISASNNPGGGATISFRLPPASPEPPSPAKV